MSPVVPKPCSMTTAGPCPPTRTWILAPLVSISRDCMPAGKGWMPSRCLLSLIALLRVSGGDDVPDRPERLDLVAGGLRRLLGCQVRREVVERLTVQGELTHT